MEKRPLESSRAVRRRRAALKQFKTTIPVAVTSQHFDPSEDNNGIKNEFDGRATTRLTNRRDRTL